MQKLDAQIQTLRILLENRQFAHAIALLETLTQTHPDHIDLLTKLAELYGQTGQVENAMCTYEQVVALTPNSANTLFNLGYFARQAGQFTKAVTAYQKAINANIARPEEVLVNMAVIHSDELGDNASAQTYLKKALVANPSYPPALMNLANLHEEAGKMDTAIPLYAKIVANDPRAYEALSRLANAQKFKNPADPVIVQIKTAIDNNQGDGFEQSCLRFAMGNALNDLGDYEEAFEHYRAGNEFSKQYLPAYDPVETEKLFDGIISVFGEIALTGVPSVSDKSSIIQPPPVFICGMFRTGSTLNEQILAGHDRIVSGGELDFFPDLANKQLQPYPHAARSLNKSNFVEFAQNHRRFIETKFSKRKLEAAQMVTDKRCDNFLYLGLIKSVFPSAKIIHTIRNPLDTCLSIYFTQFGYQQNYANDLANIVHYYQQYSRLMAHWKSLFGADILDVSYDDFVSDSETVSQQFFGFLNLEWDASLLAFHERGNFVKTASVQQVREPLYTKSSGRWRHYEAELKDIVPLLTDVKQP